MSRAFDTIADPPRSARQRVATSFRHPKVRLLILGIAVGTLIFGVQTTLTVMFFDTYFWRQWWGGQLTGPISSGVLVAWIGYIRSRWRQLHDPE